MEAQFSFTQETTLTLLVGGAGGRVGTDGGGGGGGSFVAVGSSPLIVAGGGGGGGLGYGGGNGQTTTSGGSGIGTAYGYGNASGGVSGEGGGGGGGNYGSGGGGGFYGDGGSGGDMSPGHDSLAGPGGQGGFSFLDGGTGGIQGGYYFEGPIDGGYGGGGGSACWGGGGGGGYSGGGGSQYDGGGGGGSYIDSSAIAIGTELSGVASPDDSPNGEIIISTVPEPSTLALLGIGAVSLLAYAWQKRRQMALGFLAVSAAVLSVNMASAETITYDLQQDFSTTQNPNGVWSYDLGGSPITSQISGVYGTGWCYMTGAYGYYDGSIIIGAASGGLTPGSIAIHTYSFGGDDSITWTSPAAGTIDISGLAWDEDFGGRDAKWTLTVGGQTIAFCPSIDGIQSTDAQASFANNVVSGESLNNIPVCAGDVVAFTPHTTTQYGHFMGVNMDVVMTTVPEPSTFVLFSIGAISLLAYAWRKRRQAV